LSFHHGNRQRGLIICGIPGALEYQRGILLVIAIHHDRIKVLCHQFLNGGKWLRAGNHFEVQLVKNLRDGAGGLLIGTE